MNRGSAIVKASALPACLPASMRPRFMNRGSASDDFHVDVELLASMRPRFMNRGSCPICT